jgi:acyl-CoA reductase-like NAD-dependent aldehyde dehydrogenase
MDSTARGDMLFKFARLIEENRELLATIETWDNGKPYSVSLNDDLGEVIGTIKYYAGWTDKIHGQVIGGTSAVKLAYTIREPLGVCGQIIPWNFPLAMAAWSKEVCLRSRCTLTIHHRTWPGSGHWQHRRDEGGGANTAVHPLFG